MSLKDKSCGFVATINATTMLNIDIMLTQLQEIAARTEEEFQDGQKNIQKQTKYVEKMELEIRSKQVR